MKYLTLIRHGQTTADIEDRFGGDYDDHLTDLGKEQSLQLARELLPLQIEKFFVSSRIRAYETASIIESVLQIHGSLEPLLRERNAYGVVTGLTLDEAKEKYPEVYQKLSSYDHLDVIEGGESYSDFKFRIEGAFNKALSTQFNHVGFITHGGVIRCLFRDVFKLGELKKVGDCAWVTMDLEKNEIVNSKRFEI